MSTIFASTILSLILILVLFEGLFPVGMVKVHAK